MESGLRRNLSSIQVRRFDSDLPVQVYLFVYGCLFIYMFNDRESTWR